MELRFAEKTVRKALQRGYVDAQRLLASPSQMQKFLLRLEEKEEVVRTVGEPLAAVPVLERLLRRYLDGEYTAISAAAMAQVVSALLYFVSPWDLYPDSVPGKGYADDAAVLDCCWKLCQPELEAYLAWERSAGTDRLGRKNQDRRGFSHETKDFDPGSGPGSHSGAALHRLYSPHTGGESGELRQFPEQYGRTGKG